MKKLLAVMSIVAVMGAGCIATPPPVPPVATPEAPAGKMSMAQFLEGSWKLQSVKTFRVSFDTSTSSLMLTFDGAKMNGKFCNDMSGSYTVEDDFVKFGPITSTKMFCAGLTGDAETAFIGDAQNGFRMVKQGENLILQSASGYTFVRMGSTGTEDGKVY